MDFITALLDPVAEFLQDALQGDIVRQVRRLQALRDSVRPERRGSTTAPELVIAVLLTTRHSRQTLRVAIVALLADRVALVQDVPEQLLGSSLGHEVLAAVGGRGGRPPETRQPRPHFGHQLAPLLTHAIVANRTYREHDQ